MVRAKTIKKTDDSKKKSEVREYSVTETYEKGEMVSHKVWDDVGEVIEVGSINAVMAQLTRAMAAVRDKKAA